MIVESVLVVKCWSYPPYWLSIIIYVCGSEWRICAHQFS